VDAVTGSKSRVAWLASTRSEVRPGRTTRPAAIAASERKAGRGEQVDRGGGLPQLGQVGGAGEAVDPVGDDPARVQPRPEPAVARFEGRLGPGPEPGVQVGAVVGGAPLSDPGVAVHVGPGPHQAAQLKSEQRAYDKRAQQDRWLGRHTAVEQDDRHGAPAQLLHDQRSKERAHRVTDDDQAAQPQLVDSAHDRGGQPG
jgi:hypothetical protein